jgi:hypothetical protein
MIPTAAGMPYFLYNKGSHKAEYYRYEEVVEPVIRYHEEFKPDIASAPFLSSGAAHEIAEPGMIDWPGKPGGIAGDMSTFQVIEREYMSQDEYDELIRDYTGFIFRKYIPRAYPGLKGLGSLAFNPSIILGIGPLASFFAPDALEAFDKLKRMAAENAKAGSVNAQINQKLTGLGFPPFLTGVGEVPFDIISDYFRGTVGMFEDQIECPENIAAACEIFIDIQIASWQYFRVVPLPVKRVFFPLHKGMDGFISDKQYAELYWKPYQKILRALIEMGVTPIIYTEGKYASRVSFIREQLKELPPGSCIIHFEEGDFADLKKQFSGIAAITGGMPLYLLEWGKKEEIVDRMKYLIDNCAAGGGYLFDASGSIENAKYENVVTIFETARTYGKK